MGSNILASAKIDLEKHILKGEEEGIQKSLQSFFNKDNTVKRSILDPVYSRLKYATGKLEKSISFSVKFKSFPEPTRSTIKQSISIYMIYTKPELIQALLGKDEVSTKELPSIDDLIEYINAKRKFFNNGIDDIKEYRKEMLRRRTQEIRNSLNRVSKLTGFDTNDSKIINDIARIIRHRMKSRLKKYNSILKGSEYIFGGIYSNSLTTNGKRINKAFFAKPKYKYETPALLTFKDDSGEINQYVNRLLQAYMNEMFSDIIKKTKSGDRVDKIDIGKELKKMNDSVSFLMTDTDIKEMDRLLKPLIEYSNSFPDNTNNKKVIEYRNKINEIRNYQLQQMTTHKSGKLRAIHVSMQTYMNNIKMLARRRVIMQRGRIRSW